jgi:hypothetical protein
MWRAWWRAPVVLLVSVALAVPGTAFAHTGYPYPFDDPHLSPCCSATTNRPGA